MKLFSLSHVIYNDSSFKSNVIKSFTGASLAQLIPIAASPILTRFFSPEDFGAFALYSTVISFIGALATGRYELAVMLTEEDDDSLHLLILSVLVAILLSIVILLPILLINNDIIVLYKAKQNWLYLLPLSILFMGSHQASTVWLNRRGCYNQLAINRIVQSSFSTFTSLVLGYFHLGGIGLIIGSFTGQVIAAGGVLFFISRDNKFKSIHLSRNKLFALAKRYISFPLYDIPSSFINILSNQLPLILIFNYFGPATVGLYALTLRVIKVPSTLISNSILEVFKQRASSDYNNLGNCAYIYIRTFKFLLFIALLPAMFILFYAPALFSFVFGKQWLVSGEFAQILSVVFFFGFVSSPLSYVIFIAEKQFINMIWQLALMLTAIVSILIGVQFSNVHLSLLLYSSSYSFLYVVLLALTFKLSRGNNVCSIN